MKKYFFVSLLLNALLAVALVHAFRRDAAQITPVVVSVPAAAQTLPAPASPRLVTNATWIDWRALESSDYTEYIANLRRVGCPEETIRDIIIADVAKMFAARQVAAVAPNRRMSFWQTLEQEHASLTHAAENRKKYWELENEKKAVLKELLGIDYQREMELLWGGDILESRLHKFLPEAKQEQVRALFEDVADRERRIYAASPDGLSDAQRDELSTVLQYRDVELARILSRSELEEYRLREAFLASELRNQLKGFHPTEAELRAIFKWQQTSGRELDAEPANELRALLGESRFAEFRRAWSAR